MLHLCRETVQGRVNFNYFISEKVFDLSARRSKSTTADR